MPLCAGCEDLIEDVERGAELSFSGRGPLHHRQILFSTNQSFHQNVLVFLVSDRTDGRTDGQTQ